MKSKKFSELWKVFFLEQKELYVETFCSISVYFLFQNWLGAPAALKPLGMPPGLIVIQYPVTPVYFRWFLLGFRFSERTDNTYGTVGMHFDWKTPLSVYKCDTRYSRTGTRSNSSISGHYGIPACDFGSLELSVRCKGWSKIWIWTIWIHRAKWFRVPRRSEFGPFH